MEGGLSAGDCDDLEQKYECNLDEFLSHFGACFVGRNQALRLSGGDAGLQVLLALDISVLVSYSSSLLAGGSEVCW